MKNKLASLSLIVKRKIKHSQKIFLCVSARVDRLTKSKNTITSLGTTSCDLIDFLTLNSIHVN